MGHRGNGGAAVSTHPLRGIEHALSRARAVFDWPAFLAGACAGAAGAALLLLAVVLAF